MKNGLVSRNHELFSKKVEIKRQPWFYTSHWNLGRKG